MLLTSHPALDSFLDTKLHLQCCLWTIPLLAMKYTCVCMCAGVAISREKREWEGRGSNVWQDGRGGCGSHKVILSLTCAHMCTNTYLNIIRYFIRNDPIIWMHSMCTSIKIKEHTRCNCCWLHKAHESQWRDIHVVEAILEDWEKE